MSSVKPSEIPFWATDPGVGDVTAPTTTRQETGYEQNERPIRQNENWLRQTTGDWVAFLASAGFFAGDYHPDFALPGPGADLPSTGVGFAVAATDFRAGAVVNGFRVDPVDSPAHTYTATTDTFWDLGQDAVWTPVAVTAGDPEPAVTANSVRVYLVTTDGTGRTTVVDRRRTDIPYDVALRPTAGINLEGTEALEYDDDRSVLRPSLFRSANASGLADELPDFRAIHHGRQSIDGTAEAVVWFCFNCRVSGTTWTRQTTGAARVIELSARGISVFENTTADATFLDAAWTQIFSTIPTLGLQVSGLGNALLPGEYGFETSKARTRALHPAGWAGTVTNGSNDRVEFEPEFDALTTGTGSANSSPIRCAYPINLPDDVVVTGIQLFARANAWNTDNWTIDFVRRLHTNPVEEVIATTSLSPSTAAAFQGNLVFSGSEQIDNDQYAYSLRVTIPSASTQGGMLGALEVFFNQARLGG